MFYLEELSHGGTILATLKIPSMKGNLNIVVNYDRKTSPR